MEYGIIMSNIKVWSQFIKYAKMLNKKYEMPFFMKNNYYIPNMDAFKVTSSTQLIPVEFSPLNYTMLGVSSKGHFFTLRGSGGSLIKRIIGASKPFKERLNITGFNPDEVGNDSISALINPEVYLTDNIQIDYYPVAVNIPRLMFKLKKKTLFITGVYYLPSIPEEIVQRILQLIERTGYAYLPDASSLHKIYSFKINKKGEVKNLTKSPYARIQDKILEDFGQLWNGALPVMKVSKDELQLKRADWTDRVDLYKFFDKKVRIVKTTELPAIYLKYFTMFFPPEVRGVVDSGTEQSFIDDYISVINIEDDTLELSEPVVLVEYHTRQIRKPLLMFGGHSGGQWAIENTAGFTLFFITLMHAKLFDNSFDVEISDSIHLNVNKFNRIVSLGLPEYETTIWASMRVKPYSSISSIAPVYNVKDPDSDGEFDNIWEFNNNVCVKCIPVVFNTL